GFGALYLDPTDPLLASALATGVHVAPLDGSGAYSVPASLLPTPPDGWRFQVLDLASFELSAPFRLAP
ncbi:MAG TPA: hypothetical protein VJP77_04985, partial [Planctomycetota bacterium]|nr:hypothetical protein [Planctomycetota bacterium]